MGNQESEPLTELTIFIDGDYSIGKTGLISTFINGEGTYTINQGNDMYTKREKLFNKWMTLKILDIVGQDHLKVLKERYTKSCDGILLCFDVGNRNSFVSLEEHLRLMNIYTKEKKHIMIAGLKCDTQSREVSFEEGKNWANSKGYNYIEASSKEFVNVDDVFLSIFSDIMILKQKKIMENALSVKN